MDTKKIIINIAKSFQHNKEHYFERKIYGETVRLCPRCLGKWIGIYSMLPILSLLFFIHMLPKFDILPVFVGCWMLALVGIVDWASVRVFHLWAGDNRLRFFTGISIGVAMTMYVVLMPTNILLNLFSLVVFSYSLDLIVFKYQCRDNGLTLKEGLSNKMHMMLNRSLDSQQKIFKKFPSIGKKGAIIAGACLPSCEAGPQPYNCGENCARTCSCGLCGGCGCDCCSACGGSSVLIIGLILLIVFLLFTGIAGKSGCGEDEGGCCSCGCCGGCCGGEKKEGSGGCCGDKGDSGKYSKRSSGSTSERYAEGELNQWGYEK
jgi:uncharacterized membrane protein